MPAGQIEPVIIHENVMQIADSILCVPDEGAIAANGIRIAPAQYEEESDIEQAVTPGKQQPIFLKTVSYQCRYVGS